MIRKIIIMCISIIVTIAGTIFLGYYDYNVYYNPSGDNGYIYTSRYKEYIRSNKVDVVNNSDYVKQTQEVIDLHRTLNNYKYEKDPIYREKVTVDGKDLFYIDIYRTVALYTPTGSTSEERETLEVFIYSIDYEAVKDIFMKDSVLPANKSKVEKADYPIFLVNLYPTNEYNKEEALIYTTDGASISFTLYDGTMIYGSKMDSTASFYICDYNSNPKLNSSNEPYSAKYAIIRDYQSIVNISDDNDTIDYNNRDRFANGAYVNVEAVLNVDGTYYEYNLSPTANKIESLDLATKDIDTNDLVDGFAGDVKNVKIDGLLTYNKYIFKKYVWWQCLIAFVLLGGIMTLFYFTFTYDENKAKKSK